MVRASDAQHLTRRSLLTGIASVGGAGAAYQALHALGLIPDPDELLDDINALETWRLKVEKRSVETGKKRKTVQSSR